MNELAHRLAGRAMARGLMVATAESCTGGLLSKVITDLPGASAYFRGGLVAYCNHVKAGLLGVDPGVIEREGAVSRSVALHMAAGACRQFSADVGMAVTGIAGPGGGAPDKPVGTVWLAVARSDGKAAARRMRFGGDRARVREQSVEAVLEMAIEAMKR